MDTLIERRTGWQTRSHIESEWREKRSAFAKVELAKQALLTALEDLPRPVWADEAREHDRVVALTADAIKNELDDLLGDLVGPFRKRVSEAGLDPDDYEIKGVL